MTPVGPTDILLCLLIAILAFGALGVTNPFRGVIIFIVFGLVMSLAWSRLHAPDLALTEAALGAGVIGALFLVSLRGSVEKAEEGRKKVIGVNVTTIAASVLLTVLLVSLAAAGLFNAWRLPHNGLVEAVYQSLDNTGVKNPVTAVILNYRVYDTFLEIGVLFLVMLCVFALKSDTKVPPRTSRRKDPMLWPYARGIIPLMVLTAGYLLWAGAFRPGGAFQAGAMLGGAGILLHLSRPSLLLDMRSLMARIILAAGFLTFCLLGILVLLAGLEFLQWPPHLAKYAILAIETASTLSIGLTLTGLYCAADGRLLSPAFSQSGGSEPI